MNRNNYLVGKIVKTLENYWIISCVTNVIWKCDLSFNVVDYILIKEEDSEEDLFRAILMVDDVLYCFAYNAKQSYRINTISGEIMTIEDDTLQYEKKVAKYSYAVLINDAIIVIGRKVHGFMKYDLSTRKSILVTEGWPVPGDYVCSFTHCINGNLIYTVSILDSQIVGIDIRNNKIVSYKATDFCDKNLATIMNDRKNICIVNDRCEIVTVDEKMRVIGKRRIDDWNENSIRLSGIYNKKKWFVGNKTGELVIEDGNTFTKMVLDIEIDERYGYCFSDVVVFDNNLVLQSRKNGDIIHYNFDNRCFEKITIKTNIDIMDKYLEDLMVSTNNNGSVITEDEEKNIVRLISII